MSAFVVSDETINKIVSLLYTKANNFDNWFKYNALKLQKIQGLYPETPENAERLAGKMFELNIAAVNARYGGGEAEKFRSLDFSFQLNYPGSQIAAIKALDSWLYQCSEDDIDYSRLFRAMEEIRNALCLDYVHRTKEYEAAPWG